MTNCLWLQSTGAGGCPPRQATDPPIYNTAALKAIASVPAKDRIQILDLYAIVTKKCGVGYSRCPEVRGSLAVLSIEKNACESSAETLLASPGLCPD